MNSIEIASESLSIWTAKVDPCEQINRRILEEFEAARQFWDFSHPVGGRWENVYLPSGLARNAVQYLEQLRMRAEKIVDHGLRLHHDPSQPEGNGWWFNQMGPGEKTGIHDHSDRAVLSAVYYLSAPIGAGKIVFHPEGADPVKLTPVEGQALFFPPSLKHSVEENTSPETRVSLAFNLYRSEPGPRSLS
ncbi:MAG: hypothetical protein ACI8UO_001318 [Verrucomicrobiales bacterium]